MATLRLDVDALNVTTFEIVNLDAELLEGAATDAILTCSSECQWTE